MSVAFCASILRKHFRADIDAGAEDDSAARVTQRNGPQIFSRAGLSVARRTNFRGHPRMPASSEGRNSEIAIASTIHRLWEERPKKIKEVLTRFRRFRYKRGSTLKLPLHHRL